ncbi:unnamed protein product [Leptidea sinapis]|uniref:CRAL-TRIO domain-containing protein n=1 Tax=Leptidea sinapis TaxID=189913 RepID=A0A5E4Q8T3_9NEOP|nr:unnamed protein product [Leptidea sinapis]
MATCYETLMEDEETQVRGLVHYADGSGVSFPHLTLFTPKEARTIPMRHKEIYGVNVHPTIKFALDFGMALISEKIRKRVKLYTSVEDVEIDKNLLPLEYGGTTPMKEMIVRLEMYSEAAREGAISALRSGANTCASADAVGDAMRGLTGNFRKLEVD